MAEVAGATMAVVLEKQKIEMENADIDEPDKKKARIEPQSTTLKFRLEDRLNGILCCAVCLDLPTVAVYQCTNGHLMCAGCFSHLLADSRLKDETATCPNCRCEISKSSCSRNLAVEKAISELPAECQYCCAQYPRSGLKHHQRELCQDRLVSCKYERIGCPWQGPFHEHMAHEGECQHPSKSGDDIMEALNIIDKHRESTMKHYERIFGLLSFEKIAFSDLQLRPYRSEDFIPKLYFETSRFTAFNLQWAVKAQVNENQKNPNLTSRRELSYCIILKSKVPNPMKVHYIVLQGPYGETKVSPAIYEHEFSNENTETAYKVMPISDVSECNKLLSAKTISMRLIMFQVSK